MIDYVAAHDNPKHKRHKEARRLADLLRQETVLTTRGPKTGVLRWRKTGEVVDRASARLAYFLGINISRAACNMVHQR